MKSIGHFVASKVRRSELEAELTVTTGAPQDERLGAHEATLSSAKGTIQFFELGFRIDDGRPFLYDALSALHAPSSPSSVEPLRVEFMDGHVLAFNGSPAGNLVVFATLRWIGHTRLRRNLAA